MAAKGQSEFEGAELRFFDSLRAAKDELGDVDVLYSSGALMYVPDTYQTAAELVSCERSASF